MTEKEKDNREIKVVKQVNNDETVTPKTETMAAIQRSSIALLSNMAFRNILLDPNGTTHLLPESCLISHLNLCHPNRKDNDTLHLDVFAYFGWLICEPQEETTVTYQAELPPSKLQVSLILRVHCSSGCQDILFPSYIE